MYLFLEQDKNYRDTLLQGKVIAIEASRGLEWYAFADSVNTSVERTVDSQSLITLAQHSAY